MSATQRLKAQHSTVALTNVLDFDLRKPLKEALKATGKFADVKIKLDGRRGHLNLTVRGGPVTRSADNVIKLAASKNFAIKLNQVSQSAFDSEAVYRITTLTHVTTAAVAAKPVPVAKPAPVKAASKLTTAVQATQAVAAQPAVQTTVYLNYEKLGSVSESVARQIRQLVAAENKPMFATVVVVDLATSKPVTITVPFDVAQAVRMQVPSFSHSGWVIKSTNGITILKQHDVTGAVANTWVIA
ncbi:hypothetical protein D3C75_597940 [compost metagenome]